LRMAWE